MGETGARAASSASVLRVGFAGVNARFHLVGIYTLAFLFLRFLLFLKIEDTALLPLMMASFLVIQGAVSGVLGVLFLDAAGRKEPSPFIRSASLLLVPVLWTRFKASLIVLAPAAVASLVAVAAGVQQSLEELWTSQRFWVDPGFMLAIRILALYSLPLCIEMRLYGGRRAPVRDGVRLLRSRPAESAWMVLILIAIAGLEGALLYAHGPQNAEMEPDVVDTLILFVACYLSLVTFAAAARVVLQGRPAAGGVLPGPRDAEAPGPPA